MSTSCSGTLYSGRKPKSNVDIEFVKVSYTLSISLLGGQSLSATESLLRFWMNPSRDLAFIGNSSILQVRQ
jgi:hypothetical protein